MGELRDAGFGAHRVLMTHDGTPFSSAVFEAVLSILDSGVQFSLVHVPNPRAPDKLAPGSEPTLTADRERGQTAGRTIEIHEIDGDPGIEIVRLVHEFQYDLVIVFSSASKSDPLDTPATKWTRYVQDHSPCLVFHVSLPAVPTNVAPV